MGTCAGERRWRWWAVSGLALAACGPPGAGGPVSPPVAASAGAAPAEAPAPDGAPVLVTQRVPLRAWDLAWSADDRTIVLRNREEGLFLLDATTGDVRATWPGCVQDMAFASGAGVLFYLTCEGRALGRIDLATGKSTRWPVENGSWSTTVSTYKDGHLVVLFGRPTVSVREGATGKVLFTRPIPNEGYSMKVAPDAVSVAFSAPGSITVVGLDGKERFNVANPGFEREPASLWFTPDSARIAVDRPKGVAFLDAKTGAPISEGHRPCDDKRVGQLLFSPDARQIVAGCFPGAVSGTFFGARVTLSGPDLSNPRDLALADYDPPWLRFSRDGSKLAVISPSCATILLTLASGEKLAHVLPACSRVTANDPDPIAWNADLTKAVVSEGRSETKPETGPHLIGIDGKELLRFGMFRAGKGEPPGSGSTVDEVAGNPSHEPDSTPRFSVDRKSRGVPYVKDTTTGKSRELERPKDERDVRDAGLSSRQTYTFAVNWAESNRGVFSSTVLVWNTQTGKLLAEVDAGFGYASWAVSPDETRLVVSTWRGRTCGDAPSCFGLTVHELPSTKRLHSFRLTQPLDGLTFSPDGTMILAGMAAHDLATGKLLWALPPGLGEVIGWRKSTPELVILTAGLFEIVDPRRAEIVRLIPGVTRVIAARPDGSSLLVARGETEFALLDPATGRQTALPPHPTGQVPLGFVGNRDVVRYGRDNRYLSYPYGASELRVTDGRLLFHYGDLVATDEGVFDGPETAWIEAAFRMGPDPLKNRVVPLAALRARFHRPGLLAAFRAGEKVSPAPP